MLTDKKMSATAEENVISYIRDNGNPQEKETYEDKG